MNYIIALDIGTSSVGYAAYEVDNYGDICRLLECQGNPGLGIVKFKPGIDRMGQSLAAIRRQKRSARGRLKTKRQRIRAIKALLSSGFITLAELQNIEKNVFQSSPWDLRVKALDKLVSNEEFARILLYIGKKRGQSVVDEAGKDGQVIKMSIENNKKLLAEKGYRTVGELIVKDNHFSGQRRNRGTNNYLYSVSRTMLVDEIHTIFTAQRGLGNDAATIELENAYLDIMNTAGRSQDYYSKVGNCSFFRDQKRAPVNSYSGEQFRLYCTLNALQINKQRLTEQQLELIVAHIYSSDEPKFALQDIADLLGLSKDDSLNFPEDHFRLDIGFWQQAKKVFIAYPDLWREIENNKEILDVLGEASTYFGKPESIEDYLTKADLGRFLQPCLDFDCSGTLKVSMKLIKAIMPYLRQGMVYSEACEMVGLNHADPYAGVVKRELLPRIPDNQITNPVVLRALIQARGVVNSIIKEHGSPVQIKIEMSRDFGLSARAKEKIDKMGLERRRANESARKKVLTKEWLDKEPSRKLISMQKLFDEQQGICPYCGESLACFDANPNSVEIDHILPYSRSLDDSESNKVLVHVACNQNKKKQTPYEWLGGDKGVWKKFVARVKGLFKYKNRAKKDKLFMEAFEQELPLKHLNDTRYISSFFASFVRNYLKFADSSCYEKVLCTNGRMTSLLRHNLYMGVKDREDEIHHAVDAALIAATNERMIRKITSFYKMHHSERREKGLSFPMPYVHAAGDYCTDIKGALDNVFVARKPDLKVTGSAHGESSYSLREQCDVMTKREDIAALSKKQILTRLADKDGDGKRLYEILKAKIEEISYKERERLRVEKGKTDAQIDEYFDSDKFKPFSLQPADVVFGNKPGAKIHRIRHIKLESPLASSLVKVERDGHVVNAYESAKYARIDVFVHKNTGKFEMVPVHVERYAKKEQLPQVSCTGKLINDEYGFKFSLQSDELFYVEAKCGSKTYQGCYYYCSLDSSSNRIEFEPHRVTDGQKSFRVSLNKIIAFEKKSIDVLGKIRDVKCATRDRREWHK